MKKKILKWWLKIGGVFLLAVVVNGFRFFYPYHTWLAILVLMYGVFLILKAGKFHVWDWMKEKKRWLWFLLCAFLFLWLIFTIYPVGNPFMGMKDEEVIELVNDDLRDAVIVTDHLQVTAEELFRAINAPGDLSRERQDLVKVKWDNFLVAMMESEELSELHKFFHQVPEEVEDESFMISYSLYVLKYRYFQDLVRYVGDDEVLKKTLNDQVDFLGVDNVFHDVSGRLFEPSTPVKLNGGAAYLSFTDEENGNVYYDFLRENAVENYDYMLEHFDDLLANAPVVFRDKVDFGLFETWMPVQKEVSTWLELRLVHREGGFIEEEQILEMKKLMEPGDFMVQRRNWYLTNVGIPGFWTHGVLYTGTFEEQEEYFAGEFPFMGYENYEEYFVGEFGELYDLLKAGNEFGDDIAVIEALAEGVIIDSLEHSADADFIGVLRPNLSKKDKLAALDRAYRNFGKPYDYDFDVYTLDSIFCSELIFDAYVFGEGKRGLNLDVELVSGRPTFPAKNLVEKFANERSLPERELEFVYFLKSDEKSGKAEVGTEDEFVKTAFWSKFGFMQ